MSRPRPERADDALPTPEDFAGWPPLGALSRDLLVGGMAFRMERMDAWVASALEAFPSPAPGPRDERVTIEWTRASRPAWLALAPGERARSASWLEGDALAFATHHAALLMSGTAGRGIAVLTDQDEATMRRSAQNVLRVAAAWRSAVSGRGLLVHASAVRAGDAAVVFVGPSGAGKSTAARLSAPRPVLADDACLLADEGGRLRLWPAPFWADESLPLRETALGALDVAALLRLRQAPSARVTPLPRAAAAAALAAHAPFLAGLESRIDGAALAARLAAAAPAAELAFSPDPSFWTVLETTFTTLGGPSAAARSQP